MKNFTKADLRTGDIIVTRRAGNAILIGNRFKKEMHLDNGQGLSDRNSYHEDLLHNIDKAFDIEKVYRITDGYRYSLQAIVRDLPAENVELVWEREKEIDWNKVPKFTRVLVRDRDNGQWETRRFIGCGESEVYPYSATVCDEYTFNGSQYMNWRYIKIFDESEIKEEWYK